MRAVKKQSLIAQVTDQLRAEISAGRWTVGDRIPTEPALSEMTGTARNTVREAVQSLVHAGLLERRQGSGTYVIATDEQEVLLDGYFSSARRRDLFELREALDVTAAGLAAQRRTDADVELLTEVLERRNRLWRTDAFDDPSTRQAAVAADAELHRAIVAASHNEVYLEFYDSLLPALRHSIAEGAVAGANSFDDVHRVLVEAVISGDGPAARDAAQRLLICVGETG